MHTQSSSTALSASSSASDICNINFAGPKYNNRCVDDTSDSSDSERDNYIMGEDIGSGLVSKTRGRLKKICCCGVSWVLLGIICVIIGILLLVYYAQYWSDNTNWRRGLGYAGIVFILLAILMIGIGITFCIALYIVWNRLDKSGDFAKQQFHPPSYPPGQAPYPQQGTTSPVYTQVSTTDHPSQPSQPSAPAEEFPKDVNNKDVHVEISDHHKF